MVLFTSCYKQVDTATTTTTTNNNNGSTSTVAPNIRFFNTMDYGNVSISLNNGSSTSVAQYYPTSYREGIIGTNSIIVSFGSNNVVSQSIDMIGGKYYSCFVYRVGYDWKISIVKDDLTPPTTGSCKARVLDFRTQAYFDYVGLRFFSPGNLTLDYANRNFLDHLSYDTYASFKSITAGTYTITIFTSSDNVFTKTGVLLESGKMYTALLMTPASLSRADALKNIKLDLETH